MRIPAIPVGAVQMESAIVGLPMSSCHAVTGTMFLVYVVVLGLGGWAGSIYLTRTDVDELATGSGERLLMSLIPVAAFYCAVNPLMRKSVPDGARWWRRSTRVATPRTGDDGVMSPPMPAEP